LIEINQSGRKSALVWNRCIRFWFLRDSPLHNFGDHVYVLYTLPAVPQSGTAKGGDVYTVV